MKKQAAFILLLLSAISLFADSLIITHVDGRLVLFDQQVRAYAILLDPGGQPVQSIDPQKLSVYEDWGSGQVGPLDIKSVEEGVNETEKLYISLVIDNSGSMYWNADGSVRNSENSDIWRISAAKSAVEEFIALNTNKLHKLAVISFNSTISDLTDFTSKQDELVASLQQIDKPSEEEAYTELYEAMYHAGYRMKDVPGRRIVLVLSDGENVPKKDNPVISIRHTPEEVIELYQQEGITCFTIGLSRGADEKSLQKFSVETGGVFTLEHDPARLKSLYNTIHQQLKSEFAVTYKTPLKASDETILQLHYAGITASRSYFSALLFGSPWDSFHFFYLGIVLLSVLLPLLLVISWKKGTKVKPSLKVLSGRKKTIILKDGATQSISAGGVQTKITAKGGQYTLVSKDSTVIVNNKKTKTRILQSGDLINVGGTKILFNAPDDSEI